MGSSLLKGAAATSLAALLSFGSAGNSVAGGGDFVGGMIAGGILGAIITNGTAHARPARRVSRPTYDPAVVEYWRTVQSALNEIGIPVGRPDGVPGSKTRRGVSSFQASIGVEPTGQLTQVQYNELMRQANAALAMGGGTINQPAYAALGAPAVVAAPQQGYVAATVTQPVAPVVEAIAPVPQVQAIAPAAMAEQQVAAVEPAKPADTKLLDGLLSPAKPLADAEIDTLEDASTVLGVYIGDLKADALKAFTDGVGNCKTTGSLTECSAKSDAYVDSASFATVGSSDGETVYYLSRSIDFSAPLPREAIVAKLAETLKPITDDADMTLATSTACDRATASALSDRAGVIGAYARSSVTGAVAFDKLVGECKAYFHAAVPEKDGQATGLRVQLFDSRGLPAAPASAEAKTLPQELKF